MTSEMRLAIEENEQRVHNHKVESFISQLLSAERDQEADGALLPSKELAARSALELCGRVDLMHLNLDPCARALFIAMPLFQWLRTMHPALTFRFDEVRRAVRQAVNRPTRAELERHGIDAESSPQSLEANRDTIRRLVRQARRLAEAEAAAAAEAAARRAEHDAAIGRLSGAVARAATSCPRLPTPSWACIRARRSMR